MSWRAPSGVQATAWGTRVLGAIGFLHEVFLGDPTERPVLTLASVALVTGSYFLPAPVLPKPPDPPP